MRTAQKHPDAVMVPSKSQFIGIPPAAEAARFGPIPASLPIPSSWPGEALPSGSTMGPQYNRRRQVQTDLVFPGLATIAAVAHHHRVSASLRERRSEFRAAGGSPELLAHPVALGVIDSNQWLHAARSAAHPDNDCIGNSRVKGKGIHLRGSGNFPGNLLARRDGPGLLGTI